MNAREHSRGSRRPAGSAGRGPRGPRGGGRGRTGGGKKGGICDIAVLAPASVLLNLPLVVCLALPAIVAAVLR